MRVTHDPGLYPRQILIKLSTQVGSLISNGFASPPGSSNLAAIGNSINTIQYTRQDVKTSISHHAGCPPLPGPPRAPFRSRVLGVPAPPDPPASILHSVLLNTPVFTLPLHSMSPEFFTRPGFGAFRPFANAPATAFPISIPLSPHPHPFPFLSPKPDPC